MRARIAQVSLWWITWRAHFEEFVPLSPRGNALKTWA
jgi:hypothetical protein